MASTMYIQTQQPNVPPQNSILGPQEASKGLKMTYFQGFEPTTPTGRLFLGGSGWNITSKAYNYYGPWVLGPDEPLKHLFTTSGDLKWAQNGLKLMVFSPLHLLGGFFWLDLGGTSPPKPITIISTTSFCKLITVYPQLLEYIHNFA